MKTEALLAIRKTSHQHYDGEGVEESERGSWDLESLAVLPWNDAVHELPLQHEHGGHLDVDRPVQDGEQEDREHADNHPYFLNLRRGVTDVAAGTVVVILKGSRLAGLTRRLCQPLVTCIRLQLAVNARSR